jgi:hypothetical protein
MTGGQKIRCSMFSVWHNHSFASLRGEHLSFVLASALTMLAASIQIISFSGSAPREGMLIATAGLTILVGLFACGLKNCFDRNRIPLLSVFPSMRQMDSRRVR